MQNISRADVEDFLFTEADLLDEWRLPEWLEMFTEDAIYYVPSTDVPADSSPDKNLFYVADDRFRLSERVKRLMKRKLRIREKRCLLDSEGLRTQGRVSIIL